MAVHIFPGGVFWVKVSHAGTAYFYGGSSVCSFLVNFVGRQYIEHIPVLKLGFAAFTIFLWSVKRSSIAVL
jgi:hypothetical protein